MKADSFSSSTSNASIHLILGDCIAEMKKIPDESVDMIFADPPYNLQLGGDLHRPDNSKVDAVNNDWDKFDNFQAYDQFTNNWLSEARRILRPNGTIWVIGSYHNIFRVGYSLQNLGYWVLNDIIWRKSNPMPNFRGKRFTNAHETMIWCSKSEKSKYCFNYDSMKAMNEDIQMRSDWQLPICNGNERIKAKDGQKAHPTQKPESLLSRVIIASTNVGDVVFDPFLGSGTTGAVAKRLQRHFIGIERDETYYQIATERIENTDVITEDDVLQSLSSTKQQKPRIPFGWLIESGMLRPGTQLYDTKKRFEAKVSADGSLYAASQNGYSHRGSIHKVGAELQGAPSCNGWTFWHVRKGDKLVPIDHYRETLRQRMATDQAPQSIQ